jgi:hypothetical protein
MVVSYNDSATRRRSSLIDIQAKAISITGPSVTSVPIVVVYNVAENPVSVHDLNATALQLLGIDHKRLTYRFQGRDFRLTDVEGNPVKQLL